MGICQFLSNACKIPDEPKQCSKWSPSTVKIARTLRFGLGMKPSSMNSYPSCLEFLIQCYIVHWLSLYV